MKPCGKINLVQEQKPNPYTKPLLLATKLVAQSIIIVYSLYEYPFFLY